MSIKAPVLELASITTGFLLVQPFSRMTALAEQIAGFPVWTHQIPRVSKEIAAHVPKVLPDFPTHEDAEAYGVNADTVAAYAASLVERFGQTVEVEPLESTPREPIAECAEMMGGEKPIVAVVA